MTLLEAHLLTSPGPLVLRGVAWATYVALREQIDDAGQQLYLTYDDGVLEIIPPLPIHDRIKMVVHDLIIMMCDHWGTDVEPLGSTTYRREALAKGIEPDQCYFFARAQQAREQNFDPINGPVPDLALEVDITSHSLARQPIYAALGIAELWRYQASGLEFLVLDRSGTYARVARSRVFPAIAAADLEAFVESANSMTYPQFREAFRRWLREGQTAK